jgi:hypothetical protein
MIAEKDGRPQSICQAIIEQRSKCAETSRHEDERAQIRLLNGYDGFPLVINAVKFDGWIYQLFPRLKEPLHFSCHRQEKNSK